jgi:hypothetical protein
MSVPVTDESCPLQVGLQAEEAKKSMPGAGLCPGYTISRAILADAVSLTRGDRFMTVDFTRMYFTSIDLGALNNHPQPSILPPGVTKIVNMTPRMVLLEAS